jgi:hypothetical protein
VGSRSSVVYLSSFAIEFHSSPIVNAPLCNSSMQGIEMHDAPYFRLNRKEAVALDPQTRILLEVSSCLSVESLCFARVNLSPKKNIPAIFITEIPSSL